VPQIKILQRHLEARGQSERDNSKHINWPVTTARPASSTFCDTST